MEALMDITYGMYVISAKYNDKNVGCIVNTISQVTAVNPIISVSINKENYTNKALRESKRFAVSILSEKTSKDTIGKFGFFSSENTDKFINTKYDVVSGLPVVNDNICGYAVCEVIDVIDSETHDVFLARVLSTKKINDFLPMTYKYYQEEIKGKSPKTAPTYTEEKVDDGKGKYKCKVCGHIYDEAKEKVKFEDLPEDWLCPICKAGKDKFVKMEGN